MRLPAHTPAEKEETWRGPGAWTSQEDLLDAQALEILAGINTRPYTNMRGHGDGAKWLHDVLQLLRTTAPNTTAVSGQLQPVNPAPDPVVHPAMAENLLPTFPAQTHDHDLPSHHHQPHQLLPHLSATSEQRVVKGVSKEVLLAWGLLLFMAWLMTHGETGTVRH